jgi:hypothetical protein
MRYKLSFHLIAFYEFSIGIILLHQDIFRNTHWISFFGISIYLPVYAFDVGILCLCIGFAIEFLLTFKPIKIEE